MARLGVEVIENVRVLDLMKDDRGRVCGAFASLREEPVSISARAVVLASGGAGRAFRHNVNPPTLEGDGWSMAYRAGARLVNMEFFQVGPAVFNAPIQFIIHSHMWRLMPRLTNARGEEFLPGYCPGGVDPAEVLNLKAMSYPFSVRTAAMYLDLAIFKEVMGGRGTPAGGIFFDVTHVGEETLLARAPITYRTLKKAGIDLSREKIQVGLVVQNFNGGICIDGNGFTGVEGLYAAGEVTGGVHGADRPGGNNLIDTQVFGYRAGRAAAEAASRGGTRGAVSLKQVDFPPLPREGEKLLERSADLFYSNLTIVRTKSGLKEVLAFIDLHKDNTHPLLQNRLGVGEILATAALTREESRGTHYREDFPKADPAWVKRIFIMRSGDGSPKVEVLP
jgi:succinate dehydrogenase/fumarate reductase flavoprotein subunit